MGDVVKLLTLNTIRKSIPYENKDILKADTFLEIFVFISTEKWHFVARV